MLAFVFDSVGFGEWLVLLAVVLIVVGPRRLPETARTLGRYYSKFRRAADTFRRQILEMDRELERECAADPFAAPTPEAAPAPGIEPAPEAASAPETEPAPLNEDVDHPQS